MYKYSSEGHASNTSIAEDDEYETMNKSYNSALSATSSINGSTSSKAVLAALRALQDKIRRLEAERTQALDETSQLKHQLQTQSIEAEHLRQKENLSIQKSLQEARTSYDRLLTEKNDLESRISKMEERNKSSLHMADDLQSKIRMLEDEKHGAALRLKELENRQHQFENQIKNSEHKEKDLAQSMIWETKRHEEEVNNLHRRMQSLQDELSEASRERGTTAAKITELDQLVQQLLLVNENLVNQLSGNHTIKRANSPIAMAKKVKKANKKSLAVAATLRAASQTTESFEANKTTKYEARQPSKLIPVKTNEIEQLKSMHKMYTNLARNLSRANAGESVSSSKKMSKSKRASGATADSDHVATMRSSSSSSSRVTRLSRKKAQLTDKIFDDATNHSAMSATTTRRPDSNSSSSRRHNREEGGGGHRAASPFMGSGNNGSTYNNGSTNRNVDIRLPKPIVSFDAADRDDSLADLDGSATSGHYVSNGIGGSRENSFLSHGQASRYGNSSVDASFDRNGASWSSAYQQHTGAYGSGSVTAAVAASQQQQSTDLQGVITSLEEEFQQLNNQYRRLLSNVSTSTGGDVDPSGGSSSRTDAEPEERWRSSDAIQAQAEEIVSVIQKLHNKGEQLRALKTSSPGSSPVKTASLPQRL